MTDSDVILDHDYGFDEEANGFGEPPKQPDPPPTVAKRVGRLGDMALVVLFDHLTSP